LAAPAAAAARQAQPLRCRLKVPAAAAFWARRFGLLLSASPPGCRPAMAAAPLAPRQAAARGALPVVRARRSLGVVGLPLVGGGGSLGVARCGVFPSLPALAAPPLRRAARRHSPPRAAPLP